MNDKLNKTSGSKKAAIILSDGCLQRKNVKSFSVGQSIFRRFNG